MPIYEFKCKKCENKYDLLCKYDKTEKYPKVKCPECGSKKKEKLISNFSASFGTTCRREYPYGYAGTSELLR
jgi:putative FmdB family regulatory protein